MYIPTKEELKKLGFVEFKKHGFTTLDINGDTELYYYDASQKLEITICDSYDSHSAQIYPRSLSGLKTLIEMFTPPN